MKDMVVSISLVLYLIGVRLLEICIKVIKIFIFVGIIVGGIQNISESVPDSLPPFIASFEGITDYIIIAFHVVSDSWIPIAIIVIFVWLAQMKKTLDKASNDIMHIKIANVALLNYFEIETESEGMAIGQEKGLKGVFAKMRENLLWKMFLGSAAHDIFDDTLTTIPKRKGSRVRFSEDIAEKR